MRMPSTINIICYANGTVFAGICCIVTTVNSHKNNFNHVTGCSDELGLIRVAWSEIEASAYENQKMFQMDYAGLDRSTGQIILKPLNRERLAGVIERYYELKDYRWFPIGYVEDLERSLQILDSIVPATLSVKVEHDGEGITLDLLNIEA